MTPRSLVVPLVVALSSLSSFALAEPSLTCGAGDASGIEPAQHASVVQLVCAEVAREAQGRADAVGEVRVSVRRLDRTVILSLDVARGAARDGRTLTLASLDEVPTAAPRLAAALVRGEALASTAAMNNLVGEETRAYAKRPSERFFALGLAGVSQPGAVPRHGALFVGYRVEAARFGAHVDLRLSLGGDSRDEPETSFYGAALGGRYFLSAGDVTPFVGAGVGYANVSHTERTRIDAPYVPGGSYVGVREWSVTGFTPYVEAGVMFARTTRFRVDLFARVDAPLASARDTDPSLGGSASSRYLLPVTLGASLAF